MNLWFHDLKTKLYLAWHRVLGHTHLPVQFQNVDTQEITLVYLGLEEIRALDFIYTRLPEDRARELIATLSELDAAEIESLTASDFYSFMSPEYWEEIDDTSGITS